MTVYRCSVTPNRIQALRRIGITMTALGLIGFILSCISMTMLLDDKLPDIHQMEAAHLGALLLPWGIVLLIYQKRMQKIMNDTLTLDFEREIIAYRHHDQNTEIRLRDLTRKESEFSFSPKIHLYDTAGNVVSLSADITAWTVTAEYHFIRLLNRHFNYWSILRVRFEKWKIVFIHDARKELLSTQDQGRESGA